MLQSASTHLVVVGASPTRVSDRLGGELVEGLPDEIRTRQTAVNPTGLSALLSDRCDAGMTLQINSGLPAGAVRAQSDQQARSVDRTSAWEILKQLMLGMGGKVLSKDPIEACN